MVRQVEPAVSRLRVRPRGTLVLFVGLGIGLALGTASTAWGAFVSGSTGYLPLFLPLSCVVGGIVGAGSAIFGLVAWDVLPGRARWNVGAATSAVGTIVWLGWSVVNGAGEAAYIWPSTGFAAVMMAVLGLVLVVTAKPVNRVEG